MQMPLERLFPTLQPQEVAALRKHVINTPLENLTASKVTSGFGQQLVAEIREEVQLLVAKIPLEKRDDLVPRKPVEIIVLIGGAYMDRVQIDCIVLQNGELLRTSRFTNVREQRDAFDIFKAVGFVMCDPLWRSLVLVAARTVLCKPREKPQATALFETRMTTDETDLACRRFAARKRWHHFG